MTDRIAVLIPCYNEAMTIGRVIDDFRKELPTAEIYVFDNNSTDRSAAIAAEKGTQVITVPKQGKGHVVRAMFDVIEADYYVMADGDGTYAAEHVHELLDPLRKGLADMVVGSRLDGAHEEAFRPFHRFGNVLVANLIRLIWRAEFTDIMSGYRAYNATMARSLPLLTFGFEIETEMTVQALDKGFVILEKMIPYGVRPHGSVSKLSTFRDGFKVLFLILGIFKDYKPLTFFGGMGMFLAFISLIPGGAVTRDFLADHSVEKIGPLILFVGCVLFSVMCVHIGLILHSLNWKLKELYSVVRRTQTERFGNREL